MRMKPLPLAALLALAGCSQESEPVKQSIVTCWDRNRPTSPNGAPHRPGEKFSECASSVCTGIDGGPCDG